LAISLSVGDGRAQGGGRAFHLSHGLCDPIGIQLLNIALGERGALREKIFYYQVCSLIYIKWLSRRP
jgi:hypothetical protein